MQNPKHTSLLCASFILSLFITACAGGGGSSSSVESTSSISESSSNSDSNNSSNGADDPQDATDSDMPLVTWQDELGIPDDAALLPEGTPCEEFSHVYHLPWDERPSACPTGDWCMKKDEGFIPGAVTWYGLPRASAYASITCKIGNKCYRFVGNTNCHYDL